MGAGADIEHSLLERYHRHGDFAAREALIERAMPMVRHVARRYADRGEDFEDLVQVGAIGLMKAVDRFDPDRGVRFASFAMPNITGEIRRHFRDRSWSVRVPRIQQERRALVTRLTDELTRDNQRVPTVAEIAEAAGLTLEEVLETLAAAQGHTAGSLDAQIDEERTGYDKLGGSDEGFERADERMVCVLGMRALAEREQKIVALRFVDGLTQTEIAERVGLSQMHVSRLLSKALQQMRERIESGEPNPADADAPVLRIAS